ncbi:MAG: hypothetical protein FJW14_09070 [Acidimicrobiia bacterium]|nr:hypothetical protein [Acidimicrobiia bacterium]
MRTTERLTAIATGVYGDVVKGTFGYVGDVGDVPEALTDLVRQPPSVPVYTNDHTANVGMGWWGPYVNRGLFPRDTFTDEWGQALEWGGRRGTADGRTGRGQVRSGGPDGVLGTRDDIVAPADPVETSGTLLLTVWVNRSPNPEGVEVTVYGTSNGREIRQTRRMDPERGGFSFSLTQGIHAVRVAHVSSTVDGRAVRAITSDRTFKTFVASRMQRMVDVYLGTVADVH